MKKTILLDQATTPDGRLMTLHEHDGVFMIRVDGVELMSTRQHHSEEKLAELACAHLHARSSAARVLIGGLGLGFTLRAALENLGPDAAVVVVENLCNGLVSAAFVAYFMTLCEPRFAAAQYAILSGLMFLAGALVGATSGFLVEALGYPGFFLLSIAVGVPPLLALPWAMPGAQVAGTPENRANPAS